jgi:hypothetical protein
MAELGPRARDTDELLALGQVLAWRVGMAHWRQSAIERWTLLTPALQRAVFDHAPDNARVTTELLRARLESRWNDPTAPVDTTPRARLEVVARVGDFKGLGGVFLRPPRVFAHDGALFATDGTVHVSLHADPFGATWLTEHDAPAASAVSPPWTLARTAIKRDEASLKLPALAHATSVASVHDTLAFTLPDSHRVTLVGHRTV